MFTDYCIDVSLVLSKYSQVWLIDYMWHLWGLSDIYVGVISVQKCFWVKLKKILLVKKLSFWPRQIIERKQALYEYRTGRFMNNEDPIKIIVAICLKDLISFSILYSCNKITTTQIQISCQNWNGFFSNNSHLRMI